MATETNTYRLLDVLLDGELETFVAERRQGGAPWRIIAREIYDRTGVDVTGQTLWVWFHEAAGRSA